MFAGCAPSGWTSPSYPAGSYPVDCRATEFEPRHSMAPSARTLTIRKAKRRYQRKQRNSSGLRLIAVTSVLSGVALMAYPVVEEATGAEPHWPLLPIGVAFGVTGGVFWYASDAAEPEGEPPKVATAPR